MSIDDEIYYSNDENPEEDPGRLTKILTCILLGITSMIIICATYLVIISNAKIDVVDFTGKDIQSTMSWIDQEKLEKSQYKYQYEYNEEIEKDIVIRQSVSAGEKLSKKDSIVFYISKGIDPNLEIQTPDFKNMTREEIEKFFIENKFEDYKFEYEVSTKIQKNHFIKINNTNSKIKRSDEIIVTLSVGKENVGIDIEMPNFKGESKNAIKTWCNANNIKCTYKEEFSDDVASGKIINQTPAEGTIKTGSSAAFTVSLGKGVIVEDLSGYTKAEVENWAKQRGAQVQFIEYYADSVNKGKVISNNPAKGTITESTRIKVYMSLGSPTLPDFVGKTETDVKKWVDNINESIYSKENHIGYKLVVDNTSTKPEGTILSTNPKKDSVIKFKTVITVNVAGVRSVKVDSKSNITVEEFKNYLKGLELELGDKTKEVYSNIAAGKLVRSDSGEKKVGTSINYVLSLGTYSPISTDFENKLPEDAKAILQTANNKEAGGWSLVLTESYSETVAKGKTFACNVNHTNKDIACSLSKGPEPKAIVIDDSYVGKTKGEFTSFLSGQGLVGSSTDQYSDTVAAGNIISISTGTYYAGQTVTYTVSLGKDPAKQPIVINDAKLAILNAYPKDGMTVETTKSYITNLLNEWGFTNYTFEEVTNDEPVGTLLGHNLTAGEHQKDISITVQISKGI